MRKVLTLILYTLLALLAKNVATYHKTADVQNGVHDVGIVETKENAFFVGVLASDIAGNEDETKKTIGKIAKMVVDFEQQQR